VQQEQPDNVSFILLLADFVVSARPLYLVFPLGFTSSFCFALHAISWLPDPCSGYVLDTKRRNRLTSKTGRGGGIDSKDGRSGGPVVLVKKESMRRSRTSVTTVIAVSALGYSIWKIFSAPAT
jgi:hypothetical protein